MTVFALPLLFQAGALLVSPPAPTVGDTVSITRTIAVPAEMRARAQPLGSSLLLEPLAEPLITRTREGVSIRYTFAMFEAGRQAVGLPPVELISRDGKVDLVPGDTAFVTVQSVLPAGRTPPPKPSLGPVPRFPRTHTPLAILVGAVVAATGGWAVVRRRVKPRPESGTPVLPPVPAPLMRWVAAGEGRAVAAVASDRLRARIADRLPEADRALSAGECIAVIERQKPDWPVREVSDVLRALERAQFAPAVPGDVAALVDQVDGLVKHL